MRYLKKFLAVIIIFCCFIICGISGTQQVSASESGKTDTSYTIIYDDSAYLIKDTDKPQLYDVMESISRNTNVIFTQQIQQNMEGTQLISVRIIVQNILAVQRLHQ